MHHLSTKAWSKQIKCKKLEMVRKGIQTFLCGLCVHFTSCRMLPDRFQCFPQTELWLYVVTVGKLIVAEV